MKIDVLRFRLKTRKKNSIIKSKKFNTSCGGCVRYKNLILSLKTRTDDSRAVLKINSLYLDLTKKYKFIVCW